ncbi:YwiC-like family protein [Bifidobacterium platyrrhinorum]|uniref:YwiC-like family protein n=1 Tax=Bifidobacterium platyrrhinorum TaxID=2661628 RepID=UPI00298D11D4|nr:YwiC-like family protein [Bifidobacterium platyrrhinorum]
MRPRAANPRPSRVRDWIPDQPGAWVMALAPALAGFVAGGPTPYSVWLVVLWALCYCVQFAAARWLKSRFARRYRMPVADYGAALAVLGVPFVVVNPGILRWAPVYVVLAALSFLAAWLRKERSLWGNAVAVIASSLMATVVAPYGAHNPLHVMMPSTAVMISAVFAVTQFGSVLFVKTMIRERGSRAYLVASIAWHAALFAGVTWRIGSFLPAVGMDDGSWIPSPLMWGELVSAWLLARAIALPWIGSRRRVRPVVVGMVEMVSSLLVFVAVPAMTAA